MRREIHFAKVLSNDDPLRGGGLKLQVDTLEDGVPFRGGEFVPPSFPYAGANAGWFFLPDKGAIVEVEVEADEERATEEPAARWRAVLYTAVDTIPAEFLTNQTKRGGIKYGSGILLFDKATDVLALVSSNVRLGEELATHPVMRGDTYNAELSTYLDAEDAQQTVEQAFWTTLASGPASALGVWAALPAGVPATTDMLIAFAAAMTTPAANVLAGGVTWKSAIAAFKSKLTTWLSTKVKTE